ncbi:GSCFA domain-containing protein [Christiangramia salexigens]|uniref:GSCFA domain-containing protein n=1 Tax=Christiangramia salexigens TaxID=1913577 RepID=A0A1L3J5G6_9FLAO|nr:GSCFA domain-containing protein [Christiangramia salexigens]APG60353.1 GSCFA domain-containing protein [Christiangramia salexigens]
MEFRTRIPIEEASVKIDHSSGVFLIGSCFVENIGEKLSWFKFRNLQNPTGILFHPAPISRFLSRLASNSEYGEEDVFEFNEGWQSFEAHSAMRREDKIECILSLNQALSESRSFLSGASLVVISLGTAWGYKRESDGPIVANCHKVPQNEFKKELSGIDEIKDQLRLMVASLKTINKEIQILFTVSPVRHLKDGVINNQRSKAHLISALHGFLEEQNSSSLQYFPSYEILMDELRDYRFYKNDMLHPNELAIDYIWKLFSENWIVAKSLKLNDQIDKIQKALSHRSREENSVRHKKFLTKLQLKIEEIHKKHPEITFPQAL